MDSRKITAALVIAALMTLAVVTAGCTTTSNPSPTPTPAIQTITPTGNNTTLTSTAGFKITFPSKYKLDQNGSTPVKAYIYLDPTDIRTGVVVFTEQVQSNTTLDPYVNDQLNKILLYKNFTAITNTTSGTLGGAPAKTVTFSATLPVQYNQTTAKNETLQVQEIWAINNGTAFTVTYKAPPSNFTKYLPEAQKIINSFQST